jgi:hypothetical protein
VNAQILRQSVDFSQFLERVKELGKDAAELIKTENDTIRLGRLQGRLIALDDVLSLLDQIEAEEAIEDEP